MICEKISKSEDPNPVNLSLSRKWTLHMVICRAPERFQKQEFDTMLASMFPNGLVHPERDQTYLVYDF